jgi:exonuclease V gamma subunit
LLPSLLVTVKTVWNDPFVPPVFIVPNHAIGTWLKLRITDAWGCCINFQVETIEAVLWNALHPDVSMQLLDKKTLQQFITALLDEKTATTDRLLPIRRYLMSPGGIDPVKRVQLASEIARLFLEYEYNRPSVWDAATGTSAGRWRVNGVDRTWTTDNKRYFTPRASENRRPSVAEHEAWQQYLYSTLFGDAGLLRTGRSDHDDGVPAKYYTLPQAYRRRKEEAPHDTFDNDDARPLVLFLISKISHFHRNALLEMSLTRDLHLFLVNPCSEFWEDVDTTRGVRGSRMWDSRTDGQPLPIPRMTSEEYNAEALGAGWVSSENRLLELWGAGGKENIALWCQAAQYNFTSLSPDTDASPKGTILSRIQSAILTRDIFRPLPDDLATNNPVCDDSIRFYAAPNRSREIETIRECILDILRDNPHYSVDDVAVYLPDTGAYLPFIHKVFGAYGQGEPGYLPYSVAIADAECSRYARAVADLLALCDTGFTRAGVFTFLRNACVLSAIGSNRPELKIWEKWAAQTGFFRAYDHQHRLSMGDCGASATDEHTFLFSEARLLLGNLAVSAVALGLVMPSAQEAGVVPYRDFDASDESCIERYCSTIERLAETCRSFRQECEVMPPSALAGRFRAIVDEWIYAGDAGEAHCKEIVRDALSAVALQETVAGRKHISFDEFRATVMSLLPEHRPESRDIFSGKCTFVPLQPGYVLPHKVIFTAGMDAAVFPGMNNDAPFNLLTVKRIIGDADSVKDNRYLFLELLCAAEEKLIISYQGIDIRNDRAGQPSSIVQELASFTGILLPDAAAGTSAEGNIPIAAYEAADVTRDIPCWDHFHAQIALVAHNTKRLFKYRFPEHVFNETSMETNPRLPMGTVKLTIADIALFLKNPLEYRLLRSLQLRNETADTTLVVEDEPVGSESKKLLQMKKRLLVEIIHDLFSKTGENDTEPAGIAAMIMRKVDDVYTLYYNAGQTPQAGFAQCERTMLAEWARMAGAGMGALLDGLGPCTVIDLKNERSSGSGISPCISMTLRNGRRVRLTAEHPLVLIPVAIQEPAVLIKMGSFNNDTYSTPHIDVWLTALLLAINGRPHSSIGIVDPVTGKVAVTVWNTPEPWSPDTAATWLGEVIGDMVVRQEGTHTPAIWIEQAARTNDAFDGDFIERLQAVAENDSDEEGGYPRRYRSFSDAIKLTEARLPDDGKTLCRAYRRLYPIFRGVFGERD